MAHRENSHITLGSYQVSPDLLRHSGLQHEDQCDESNPLSGPPQLSPINVYFYTHITIRSRVLNFLIGW